jgi:hypothetical protein
MSYPTYDECRFETEEEFKRHAAWLKSEFEECRKRAAENAEIWRKFGHKSKVKVRK